MRLAAPTNWVSVWLVACQAAYVGPPTGSVAVATGDAGAVGTGGASPHGAESAVVGAGGDSTVTTLSKSTTAGTSSRSFEPAETRGGALATEPTRVDTGGGRPSGGGAAGVGGWGGVPSRGGTVGSSPADAFGRAGNLGATSNAGSSATASTIRTVESTWGTSKEFGTQIPVCWASRVADGRTIENTPLADLVSDYSVATLQNWVREAVENTWGRFANLSFAANELDGVTREWPTCASASPKGTMVVDFTTGEDFADRGRFDDSPTRIRLHVPRPGPGEYSQAAIRAFGMACHLGDALQDGTVHPYDVAFSQLMYGRKHSGAIVGWGGRCVQQNSAAADKRTSWYKPVGLGPCGNVAYQRWYPFEVDSTGDLALHVEYADWWTSCATMVGDSSQAILQTGMCSRQEKWRFPLAAMQWQGIGGLCVEAAAEAQGAGLSLQTCTATALQRWDLFSQDVGQMRLSGTGFCVAATPSNRELPAGTALQLAACSEADAAQRFDLSLHAHIRYDADVCVQADAATLQSGAPLVLASPCSELAVEQMFNLAGTIAQEGLYLSVPNNLSFDAVSLVMRTRDFTRSAVPSLPEWQQWEYHW